MSTSLRFCNGALDTTTTLTVGPQEIKILEGLTPEKIEMATTNLPIMLGQNLPGWAFAALIFTVIIAVHRLGSHSAITKFPLLGKEYGNRRKRAAAFLNEPVKLYEEGYRRFKNQVYRLTMPDGW